MNRRVLTAGSLAGVVVFLWAFLSHMALGLGEMGISALPAEAPVLGAIKQHVPEAGFYFFPNEGDPTKMEDAYRTNAHGILVSSPAGSELAFGRRLSLELLANVLAGILLAWVAGRLGGAMGWARGAGLGLALGLFAHFAIDASYVIWYDFPIEYGLAQLVEQTVGYGLGGAVAGWFLGRPATS